MFSKSKQVRLAKESGIYKKLSISPEFKDSKEDGIRTDGKEGSYEWWYVDSEMEDGTTIVVVFYTKNRFDVSGPSWPTVMIEISHPDGTKTEVISRDEKGTLISAKKDRCDVSIKNSYLRFENGNYIMHFEEGNIIYDAVMTSTLPMWRPNSGHWLFGDNDENFFAWFVAQPSAKIESKLIMDGKTTLFQGNSYHDHNWGNISMEKLMNHWYWGRAKVGEYDIIACDIIAEKKYGNKRLPVFMLAKNGEIIADEASNVKISRGGTIEHPITKKFMDNHLTYDYPISSSESYTVEFIRDRDMTSESMLNMLDPKVAKLAKLAGANPTYTRVLGEVKLTHIVNGEKTVYESEGLWEQMFFGNNKHATIAD